MEDVCLFVSVAMCLCACQRASERVYVSMCFCGSPCRWEYSFQCVYRPVCTYRDLILSQWISVSLSVSVHIYLSGESKGLCACLFVCKSVCTCGGAGVERVWSFYTWQPRSQSELFERHYISMSCVTQCERYLACDSIQSFGSSWPQI